MKYMLSFNRGRKIAIALDKDKKKVFDIRVTEERELPDIQCDDVISLIDEVDIKAIKRSLSMGIIEEKVLKKLLKGRNKLPKTKEGNIDIEAVKASDKIKRAIRILIEKCEEKLKTEVNFSDDKSIKSVIPLIGQNDVPYDRSIFLCAASAAGKSYMTKLILEQDLRKRPVVLFSKIPDDKSLASLEKEKLTRSSGGKVKKSNGSDEKEITQHFPGEEGKSRLIKIPLLSDDDLVDLPVPSDLKSTVCVFDDVDSFKSSVASYIRDYRDSILESGRHQNITCICTSHILNNYNRTKVMHNEAEVIILFPSSNKRHASTFLRDKLGLERNEREYLIDKSMRSGRYLAIKMSSPCMLIHNGGAILL